MKFKIGIGVVIKKGDKVLIGQRIGSHGADTWSFPGGHLEEDETPEVTGQREVLEETGLTVSNLTPSGFTFDHFEEIDTNYLTLFYSCNWTEGTPVVVEKEKCREWRWESINNLPEPLFKPISSFLKQSNLV